LDEGGGADPSDPPPPQADSTTLSDANVAHTNFRSIVPRIAFREC
jgi:hypothetical protein